MENIKTFRVKKQLLHDRIYKVGEPIDLDTDIAGDFLDQDLIEEVDGKPLTPVAGDKEKTVDNFLNSQGDMMAGRSDNNKAQIALNELQGKNDELELKVMEQEDKITEQANTIDSHLLTIDELKEDMGVLDQANLDLTTGIEELKNQLRVLDPNYDGEDTGKSKIELDKSAGDEIKNNESAGNENDLTGKKD